MESVEWIAGTVYAIMSILRINDLLTFLHCRPA